MQAILRVPLMLSLLAMMATLTTVAGAQSTSQKPLNDYKVFFDLKDAKVSKSALPILDYVVEDFKSKGATRVHVEGNTDASAAEAENKQLAQTRANAVRDALVAKGLPATAITTVAAGSSKPMVPTPKGEREPQNRRVEITLWK